MSTPLRLQGDKTVELGSAGVVRLRVHVEDATRLSRKDRVLLDELCALMNVRSSMAGEQGINPDTTAVAT